MQARRTRKDKSAQVAPDQQPLHGGPPAANGDAHEADELIAVIAHELRSPLMAIRNAVHVLHHHGDDAAQRSWVVGVLERQSQQMICLVEDLLDLARLNKGKLQLHKQPISITEAVEEAVQTIRPGLEARGLILQMNLPCEPLTVAADPTRLQQIFLNLLDNAAKYTDAGGVISLTVERGCGHIVVRVRDTGIGIDPAMLTHVFDLFAQSARAVDHCQGGLGIGLALVRELVEGHGGRVNAFSEGTGRGSEFVVQLPQFTATAVPCAGMP